MNSQSLVAKKPVADELDRSLMATHQCVERLLIPATREHRHMIPGRGAIDFPAVLREIAGSGYDGWVTVELYPYIENPDQAGREAKQFVEQKAPTRVEP